MSKIQKKILKPINIIFLSCLLGVILIVNSNYVNKEKLLNKKNEIVEYLFSPRKLEGSNIDYSQKVCSKASDDLNEFYATGDFSKIGLEDDRIKCDDKEATYLQNLINLVNHARDKECVELEGSLEDSAKDYAMHYLAMAVFLTFGLLAIFGWIICCFCWCCNCCCCCCCKRKPICKKICFVFTYVFYALVVAACSYGLSQTSNVFSAMNDTGCSILKFFDQLLNGETQTDQPYWAGVNSIKDTLSDLTDYIGQSGHSAHEQLSQSMNRLDNYEQNFTSYMNESSEYLYNNLEDYSGNYTYTPLDSQEKQYVLDMVQQFGKHNPTDNSYTPLSTLFNWTIEYNAVATNARHYLTIANNAFDDILSSRIDDVVDKLTEGEDKIEEISKPVEDLNENLGEIFDELGDYASDYGKMALHSIFTVLMVINICLGGLMFLLCFFSMKQCTSCCLCRCLFKCGIHLSWNILAIMMIFSFLVGSILGIIGLLGSDIMSLITYTLSEENFNSSTTPFLLDEIGDAKDYLYEFIHGSGDISEQLNLSQSLNSFNDINSVQESIRNLRGGFSEIISQCIVYNSTIKLLKKKQELNEDIFLKEINQNILVASGISYFELINKINLTSIKLGKQYSWKINSPHPNCNDDPTYGYVFNPKNCKPIDILDSLSAGDKTTEDGKNFILYASILNDTDYFIDNANKIYGSGDKKSYKEILDELRDRYVSYLSQYDETLNTFNIIIENIMGRIRHLIGDGNNNTFSFMNGGFVRKHIKVILKNLKDAFGKNIYSVAVCLNIAGCSLILSISSTLLLLAIINEELKQHIQNENHPNPGTSSVSPFTPNNVPAFPLQKV